MTSSTELAALLCSRLCHDLLSPVGAIGNGLELLADESDPAMRANCMDLLEQSARTSLVKLQFYRYAYGSPAALGESVPVEEPRALLEALVADQGGIELEWALETATLDRTAMKVLLNFAAIGTSALVRGGTLIVGVETSEGASEIVVRASGPRIAFDEAIGAMLAGEGNPDTLTSHTAPAFLVRALVEEAGGEVQHALSEEALVMGALLSGGGQAD